MDEDRDYYGVHRFRGRWRAQASIDSEHVSIGVFDDPREAAIARDAVIHERAPYGRHTLNADVYHDLPYPGEDRTRSRS